MRGGGVSETSICWYGNPPERTSLWEHQPSRRSVVLSVCLVARLWCQVMREWTVLRRKYLRTSDAD